MDVLRQTQITSHITLTWRGASPARCRDDGLRPHVARTVIEPEKNPGGIPVDRDDNAAPAVALRHVDKRAAETHRERLEIARVELIVEAQIAV
jgi:hypothetical protein